MSDLCILEVVDRDNNPVPDGQVGEKVLVTNLFNKVQPFIRYEMSDVTGYAASSCDCDLPFPTILPVEGRTDDVFYINGLDGDYEAIHPMLFLGPIVELDEVRIYQLVQTGRNEITFRYVPTDATQNSESHIRDVLEDGLKSASLLGRISLKLERRDDIVRNGRSGKFKQIISLMPPV